MKSTKTSSNNFARLSLSRRDFGKTILAGGLASALGGMIPSTTHAEPADAEPSAKPFGFDYILGSSMYGTTSVEEILAQLKTTHCSAIDIWPRKHADQREQVESMGHDQFRELLTKYQTRLGILTRYDLGPFKLAPEIAVAKEFSCPMIVTGVGTRPAANADERKAAIKGFKEKFAPTLALAEETGIVIAIENHLNTLLESCDDIRAFADAFSSPHIGIALAPYHLPQEPQELAGLIRDLGPRLVHFYAWEHGKGSHTKLPKEEELMQMPGYGPLDFGPLVEALRTIDYQGFTEPFMHPVPRGIPIMPTTPEVSAVINKSESYLNSFLKS